MEMSREKPVQKKKKKEVNTKPDSCQLINVSLVTAKYVNVWLEEK